MINFIGRRPLAGFLLGMLLLATLTTGMQVAWALWHLLPSLLTLAAVTAGAYALGRRDARARARKTAIRRLKDAQREQQVAELEQLAGRSLDEILASYRLIGRRYGRARDDR
jgi:membrane protein required for beta-lactamase induction